MIYVEDDFIPEKEFSELRDLIPKRYIKHREHLKSPDAYESIRLTWHDPRGDWQEGCKFLGIASRPAVEKLIQTFDKLNIPAVSYSLWYAYMFPTMRFAPHIDGELRQSNRNHTYTCMYYTSDWEPGWGGELVFGEPIYKGRVMIGVKPEMIVEPKPNRQVIFSREHPHEVYRVSHPDPNYMRCALGSGWSSLKDREEYRNVLKVS
jgi:hypothetical protein